MQRAPELESFAREPIGPYLVSAAWVHFCGHSEVVGIVFFRRPDPADVERLTHALVVELAQGVVPHRSLVDASGLGGVDAGAFEVLSGYVRAHHTRLSQQVTQLALVRPSGMEGALVTGFFGVLDAPYPVSVFDDPAAALAWLGEKDPTVAGELAAIVEQVSGVPPAVGALRGLLAGNLELTSQQAGDALGMSWRTLQRRLKDAGTTFQREVAAARLRDAQRRMLDSDDPLTAVAIDVGFATLQHFSAAFREATGETPSAWRAKRRG